MNKTITFSKSLNYSIRSGKNIITLEAVESERGVTRRIVLKSNLYGCSVTKLLFELPEDSIDDFISILQELKSIKDHDPENMTIRYKGIEDQTHDSM